MLPSSGRLSATYVHKLNRNTHSALINASTRVEGVGVLFTEGDVVHPLVDSHQSLFDGLAAFTWGKNNWLLPGGPGTTVSNRIEPAASDLLRVRGRALVCQHRHLRFRLDDLDDPCLGIEVVRVGSGHIFGSCRSSTVMVDSSELQL